MNLECFGMLKYLKLAYQIFHKSVVRIMKVSCKERLPRMIKYWNYKKFLNAHFKYSVNENFANNTKLDYNNFEETILNLLSS